MELILRSRRHRTIAVQRRENLRERDNPFDLSETNCIKKYRLSKAATQELIDKLCPNLKRRTFRSFAVPCHVIVLSSLRLLATGSFQRVCGDTHHHMISQPTMSIVLNEFLNAMVLHTKDYISFPKTQTDFNEINLGFYQKFGVPSILGVIDGTHVAIKKPCSDDNFCFMSRKGFYSLNVQVVCDHNQIIRNIVAKWPGSAHDSFIFKTSALYSLIHNPNNQYVGYLIADSAYSLTPHCMTPINDPKTEAEVHYNHVHKKVRNIIERTIGVWKMRFRVLDMSGGVLQYKPAKCAKIILVTAILHNICMQRNIPMFEDIQILEDHESLESTSNFEEEFHTDDLILRRRGENERNIFVSRLHRNQT